MRPAPLTPCVISARTSVGSWNDVPQPGRAKISGDVRTSLNDPRALSCSSPHGTKSFLALFDANRLTRSRF